MCLGKKTPSLSRCLSVSLSLIYVFTYICLFFCLWLCKHIWTPLLTEFCLLILCHFSQFSFISCNGPNRIPPLTNQRCWSLDIRWSGIKGWIQSCSIIKEISKMMWGHVQVVSKANPGSNVVFWDFTKKIAFESHRFCWKFFFHDRCHVSVDYHTFTVKDLSEVRNNRVSL